MGTCIKVVSAYRPPLIIIKYTITLERQSKVLILEIKMKAVFALFTVLATFAWAQDTHYCPDGWELHSVPDHDKCQCFLFAPFGVKVTHGDATLICNGHGGWLTELEDEGGHDNRWIVNQLLARLGDEKPKGNELEGPHYEDSWWIGAKSYTKHNDHNPGEWYWEVHNTTLEWFDWAPGQPNDYHRQQCMSYLRYDYFGDTTYNWNDLDCNTVADYICEKPCAM